MGLFGRRSVEIASLQEDIKILQSANEGLKKEKIKHNEELENLKLKKRLEQEEIKHLTKINEERMNQQVENKKIELIREYNEKINKFKEEQTAGLLTLHKELHGKMEGRFNTELGNLKDIYKALMDRLPNVTLALEKKL